MARTSLIIRPILEFLFPSADELTLQLYHGYIRKLAHFTEYGVLAFLALRAFTGSAARYAVALVLVALIASIDEFNQSFEASRTSSVWDVLLDITGGLFVIGICYLWRRRSLKR
jgi:VanZ family protein